MQVARKEHAAVFLRNQVYVIGGYNSTCKEMLDTVEAYNLENDT